VTVIRTAVANQALILVRISEIVFLLIVSLLYTWLSGLDVHNEIQHLPTKRGLKILQLHPLDHLDLCQLWAKPDLGARSAAETPNSDDDPAYRHEPIRTTSGD